MRKEQEEARRIEQEAARGRKQEAKHLEIKVLGLQKEEKEERTSKAMARGELTPPATPGSDQTERRSRRTGPRSGA